MNHFGTSFRAALARFRPLAPRPPRQCSTAAAAGAGAVGPLALGLGQSAAVRLGSAMTLLAGGGAAAVWQSQSSDEGEVTATSELPFVAELIAKESVTEVHSPGNQLRKHPIGKLLVDQDHLVGIFDLVQASYLGLMYALPCTDNAHASLLCSLRP